VHAINHRDLGTPAPAAGEPVTLEIDGHSVTVPAGTSIMRAAALSGTAIPKLCATDTLEAFGSCRMCLVEVEGRRGYPASCTTTVAPGMKVHTGTPRLDALRRGVLDLYLSDHPLDCDACPADGHCELQSMAYRYDLTGSTLPAAGASLLGKPVDASNP
jgi:formate dehydrogenase major subunit